jgi:hypothetical protein
VARAKGEPAARPIATETRLEFLALAPGAGASDNGAFIPFDYIEDEPLRVAIYRRVAEADAAARIADLRAELADRFGPPPPPVDRMLRVAGLRIEAARRNIRRITVREGKLALLRAGDYLTDNGKLPAIEGRTSDEKLACVERLVRRLAPVRTQPGDAAVAQPPPRRWKPQTIHLK